MKKKKYEAPQTQFQEVELEGGFMLASIGKDPEDSKGTITIIDQSTGVALGGEHPDAGWSEGNFETTPGDWDI